ncbi:hypothetical protein Q8A73_020920 [Channa argus]|nr:hypothetical protein Q8A73_020920 [Channa argus]
MFRVMYAFYSSTVLSCSSSRSAQASDSALPREQSPEVGRASDRGRAELNTAAFTEDMRKNLHSAAIAYKPGSVASQHERKGFDNAVQVPGASMKSLQRRHD